jgi:DNA polymerase-3 subunit epsilon
MNTNPFPTLPPGLILDRRLAFFDLEATGLNKRMDRIVSIAILRYSPGNPFPLPIHYLVNPTIPIPAEATAIHHITDADVAEAPTFAELAGAIAGDLENCDLAGYNILGFDIPLLAEEFARARVPFPLEGRRILDAQRIYFKREPRDLTAALRYYCGEDPTAAHDAMGDTIATVKVLGGQFAKYGDLPTDVAALDDYCNPRDPGFVDRGRRLRWVNGQVALNFGKFQGRLLRDVIREDRGFIKWLLNADFPEDTKAIVRNAEKGFYPTPPTA